MLQERGFSTVPYGTIRSDPDLFRGILAEQRGFAEQRVGNAGLMCQ